MQRQRWWWTKTVKLRAVKTKQLAERWGGTAVSPWATPVTSHVGIWSTDNVNIHECSFFFAMEYDSAFSKLSGLNLSERAVYFPMKAAPSTFTAIINEIDIFNYLFPAFTRLFERTAKEQLLASTGKRRRVIENKEGSICLFERWRVISHQYLCVAYHHRSRFPPGVANTVGHEGMYQYCWSYADRRVVCLVLHTEAEQLVQWPNAIDIKWLCSAVQFSYTEKYCLYKLIFV